MEITELGPLPGLSARGERAKGRMLLWVYDHEHRWRAAIHGFDKTILDKEVAPGLKVVEKTQARGVKALEELQYRRKGLAVSALIIFALVVGLILKIRQMERNAK